MFGLSCGVLMLVSGGAWGKQSLEPTVITGGKVREYCVAELDKGEKEENLIRLWDIEERFAT